MNLISILRLLGDCGSYQIYVFGITCIIHIFSGLHTLAGVFLMGEPKFRCYVPNCDNVSSHFEEEYTEFSIPNVTNSKGQLIQSPCSQFLQNVNMRCDSMSFNHSTIVDCKNSYVWDKTDFKSTTISEFILVCDKSWYKAYSSSFFMMGVLVGSAVFGLISDRCGRKTVIMVSSVTLLCSAIATAFSSNFVLFSVCRFFIAASNIGLGQAAFILGIEYVGPSQRIICSIIGNLFYAAGQLTLGVLAYFIRDWRFLQISISLPCLLMLIYYWILPESIRWLVSKGKHEKAKKTILNAAKWNKVVIPKSYLEFIDDDMPQPKVGPLDLLKTPRLRKWSLMIFLIWITNSMVYYGLALNTGSLYGDIYTNFCLLAIAEMISSILSIFGFVFYGSRCTLGFTLILCGLACAATLFIPIDMHWLIILLAFLGRSGINVSFSAVYLYSSEIFPTVLRSTGIGMSSTVARIGSIISPIIIQIGETYHYFPMIVFSTFAIVSGMLTFYLPETFKRHLPDSVLEAENFEICMETFIDNKLLDEEEKLIEDDEEVEDVNS